MTDRRWTWWLVWSGLAAGFFLGGAVARDSSLFGSNVAAWVQAIGSVVAILISMFGVMYLQDRERKEAAKASRIEWLEALTGIATACDELIQQQHTVTAKKPVGAEFEYLKRPNRLATVHAAIMAVTLERAYPADLAMAIIKMQHVTSKALRLVSGHKPEHPATAPVDIDLSDCAERSAVALAVIKTALNVAKA